jgi:hypothetical protein
VKQSLQTASNTLHAYWLSLGNHPIKDCLACLSLIRRADVVCTVDYHSFMPFSPSLSLSFRKMLSIEKVISTQPEELSSHSSK